MFRPECTRCHHVNPSGSKYCIRCGAQLLLVACPSCGALNDVNARTCHTCAVALPEHDSRTLTLAAVRAEELAGSAVGSGGDASDTSFSAAAHVSVQTDRVEADSSHGLGGAWAGSAPAAFAGSRPAASIPKAPRAQRVTPVLIVLAIAALAALGWYAYRYMPIDIPQRAESGDRDRRSVPLDNQSAVPAAAKKHETDKQAKRDGRPACSDAVAALGLCAPQPAQRRE